MSTKIDFSVAELLSSRICHDLVSSINAISAGLELLSEDVGEAGSEPLQLVMKSSRQASARISLFRIAFGLFRGGKGEVTLFKVKELIANYFESLPVEVRWDEGNLENGEDTKISKYAVKLLLNLILLGNECLPSRGRISVYLAVIDGYLGIGLQVIGENVSLRDGIALAIRPNITVSELSPSSVQAYFAFKLAEALGTTIEIKVIEKESVEIATRVIL